MQQLHAQPHTQPHAPPPAPPPHSSTFAERVVAAVVIRMLSSWRYLVGGGGSSSSSNSMSSMSSSSSASIGGYGVEALDEASVERQISAMLHVSSTHGLSGGGGGGVAVAAAPAASAASAASAVALQPCPFAKFGCPAMLAPSAILEHSATETAIHLDLVLSKFKVICAQREDAMLAMTHAQTRCRKAEDVANTLRAQNAQLVEQVAQMQATVHVQAASAAREREQFERTTQADQRKLAELARVADKAEQSRANVARLEATVAQQAAQLECMREELERERERARQSASGSPAAPPTASPAASPASLVETHDKACMATPVSILLHSGGGVAGAHTSRVLSSSAFLQPSAHVRDVASGHPSSDHDDSDVDATTDGDAHDSSSSAEQQLGATKAFTALRYLVYALTGKLEDGVSVEASPKRAAAVAPSRARRGVRRGGDRAVGGANAFGGLARPRTTFTSLHSQPWAGSSPSFTNTLGANSVHHKSTFTASGFAAAGGATGVPHDDFVQEQLWTQLFGDMTVEQVDSIMSSLFPSNASGGGGNARSNGNKNNLSALLSYLDADLDDEDLLAFAGTLRNDDDDENRTDGNDDHADEKSTDEDSDGEEEEDNAAAAADDLGIGKSIGAQYGLQPLCPVLLTRKAKELLFGIKTEPRRVPRSYLQDEITLE